MKLIVLAVLLSIAVFRADCRERPNGSDLPDGHGDVDLDASYDGDLYYNSDFSGEPVDGSFPPIDVRGGYRNQESSDIDQLEEGEESQFERRRKGSQKLLKQIVKQLQSLDEKVTASMSRMANFTVGLDALKTNVINILNFTTANSNVKNDLEFIKDNVTNAIVVLDSKVESIIEKQANFRNGSFQMKKDLEFIKFNVTNAIANQDSKLHSIIEKQECPDGTFFYAPSKQCFRLLQDKERTFAEAQDACIVLGLELSRPYDPIGLRKYITENYGNVGFTWINARSDGSNFKWQRTGQIVSKDSVLWTAGQPGSYYTNPDIGIGLQNFASFVLSRPNTVYQCLHINNKYWTLCEMVNA